MRIKSSLKILSVVFFIFCTLNVTAQNDQNKKLPNFLMPDFFRATIKFKSGETKTAIINYNLIDEEIVFNQQDNYLVLENPSIIDTIYFNDRKMVPINAAFFEVLLEESTTLFLQHKVNIELQGTPSGYGTTSQSANTKYVKQIYGATGSVDLNIPDDYKLTENNFYWIKQNNLFEKFANKRQFLKIFKSKEKELSYYFDKTSIDFNNNNDVIKLCAYLNNLK